MKTPYTIAIARLCTTQNPAIRSDSTSFALRVRVVQMPEHNHRTVT